MSVYMLYNTIDDDFYIGSTKIPLSRRLQIHKYYANKNLSRLYSKMLFLGTEHWKIKLLKKCDGNLLQEEEDVRKSLNPSLNTKVSYVGFECKGNSDYYKNYYQANKEKYRAYYQKKKLTKV